MIAFLITIGFVLYFIVGLTLGVLFVRQEFGPDRDKVDTATAGFLIVCVALVWPLAGLLWIIGKAATTRRPEPEEKAPETDAEPQEKVE